MIARQFGWRFMSLNIYTGTPAAASSRRGRLATAHENGRSIAALWREKNFGPFSVM
jgi:hypothetical protein